MKYIILFCIVLFALPAFGQQDSIAYEKRVNKSENFKGDSIFYKLTYTKQGEVMIVRVEPFTDQDSLMGNVLYNEFTDASRQYKSTILAAQESEKGYELRLRQAEKQYLDFVGKPIKEKVEAGFDFAELIGDWLLNKDAITIDEKLLINKQPIKILSDQQFTVEIAKERVVFNLVKPGLWVSKGEKYRLLRVKVNKKQNK